MRPARRHVAVGLLVVLLVAALATTARLAGAPREGLPVARSVTLAPVDAPVAATSSRGPGTARRTPTADARWIASTSAAQGIPATAVAAYADATLRLAHEEPRCRLAWNTLAGIGWVESQHGTIGGRSLGVDGRPSTPVLGPALDGRDYAAVPATADSVRWHGDRRWDHAVGPMQFIPSTWARWASDGDRDGTADPHDLFDAAYATARYLCASGGDLTTAGGWTAAVRSYNHSDAYVASVLAAADAYAR